LAGEVASQSPSLPGATPPVRHQIRERKDYTLLGDLPTATDKARRDAPSIPVCDV